MRRKVLYFIILFLAAAVIAGCGKGSAGKVRDETVPVKVMNVKKENLKKVLEYVGDIKGQDEAILYPKVSGKIIEKVKEAGSPVNKGEAIAYVDRDEIGLKFEKAPVESPLTGIVGRLYVDIGSNVTPQTAIAMVADMTKAEINLEIPERYLPKVSLGQEAELEIDAYPSDKFIGKVTRISPIVDLETRAAPIEITIDNADNKLQSGMFARVRLIIEEHKDVPIILKEAIIGREPDTYVYIVEGSKAVLKRVRLGLREGPHYEVLEGVEAGDTVVIVGQQRLRDGAPVRTEE
ncbi:MAG: efflux RND transporter periplasmic adaptor subunit [Candidatus Omnitrophica bacterium]|nr:efflux RND transporter periplasmic adaptor subunit [Candidatus Omnitrophota bacterium]